MPKSKEAWLDDLLCREDTLYSSRINFFILSQTMLLFSYATSIALENTVNNFFAIYISILALIVTIYFTMIFHRTVDYIQYLRGRLKEVSPKYKNILDERRNKEGRELAGVNILIGECISICFFTVWVFLLFFSLHLDFYSMPSIVYLLFFISLLTYSLCQILKGTHF